MVLLRLRIHGDRLEVIACDETGARRFLGTIVEITPNGRLIRLASLNTRFGFQLDERRRIRYAE